MECGFTIVVVYCLVTKSYLTLVTPWIVACQAPLSMEFPRQEYWGGLPFPSLRDRPDPGMELTSPSLAGGEPPGKPISTCGKCRLMNVLKIVIRIKNDQSNFWKFIA